MLDTKNYPCPQCRKRMKSTSGLTRYRNACTSLPLHIQSDQNTPMLVEDDDASDHFQHHEEEEYLLGNEGQEIRENQRDSGQSLNNKSLRDILPGRTPQAGLLGSESSSSLREVRFRDQEFAAGISISNIKYNHPGFQNNNLFYPFYDQLGYRRAKYFAESETTKSNRDKFLSDPLMAPLTEKLSYRNADEWIEKLLEIPWGIPKDEWIKHKFEHQSGMT